MPTTDFDGNARLWILGKVGVKDGVGNLTPKVYRDDPAETSLGGAIGYLVLRSCIGIQAASV